MKKFMLIAVAAFTVKAVAVVMAYDWFKKSPLKEALAGKVKEYLDEDDFDEDEDL